MAHHTASSNYKGNIPLESQLNITPTQHQSQHPASQTVRYFAATATSAAPYISPYPPTTASDPDLREAASVKESALPVSIHSSSHQASSIQISAESRPRIMSFSKTISAVCEIFALVSANLFTFIIYILLPVRCTICIGTRDFLSSPVLLLRCYLHLHPHSPFSITK